MFTGLIEEIGRLTRTESVGAGKRLTIAANRVTQELSVGESVAINGVCLTVVALEPGGFAVESVGETLARTTLSFLNPGERVNLERALRASARLDGHFVQGHVDGFGTIAGSERRDPGLWLRIHLDAGLLKYIVEKGSIAIDGVSLTVAEVNEEGISIAVIPHTAEHTTLGGMKSGLRVNVETDLLGKYVLRFLQTPAFKDTITPKKLEEWGY